MITIKCSGCHTKLWKYEKIGKGSILICHRSRIQKFYKIRLCEDKILCECGVEVGIDKGDHIKMIAKGFTASGTKST